MFPFILRRYDVTNDSIFTIGLSGHSHDVRRADTETRFGGSGPDGRGQGQRYVVGTGDQRIAGAFNYTAR